MMSAGAGNGCSSAAELPPAAPRAPTPAAPRRLVLSFQGSRGDCQPYIALALGLLARGHRVKVLSHATHQDFVKSYGIDFAAFAPDRQGEDFGRFLFTNKFLTQDLRAFAEEVKKFDPEMLLSGTLTEKLCFCTGEAMGIPTLRIALQNIVPSARRLPLVARYFPKRLGWANLLLWRLAIQLFLLHSREADASCQKVLGIRVFDGIQGRAVWDIARQVPSPYSITANPRPLAEAMLGYISPNVRHTGYLVLEEKRQADAAAAAHFGSRDARRELEAFIAAGDPPVYMGWGSMNPTSAESLIVLAVGAAKAAGRRAVILSGWAGLSHGALEAAARARGRPELLEFAERNVIIMEQAPHEWLFPRCACTVHHGGSGTTAAALRSGVPTIITPIAFDQFEYADMVQELGVGLALHGFQKRLLKPSGEKELGDAIARACSSASIRQRAAELGRRLVSEDGVAATVSEIERLLALHDLGEYRTFVQCVRERQRELDARSEELGPVRLSLYLASPLLLTRLLRRLASRMPPVHRMHPRAAL